MQKGFSVILILVGILVMAVTVAGIYLKLANSDFENCKKISGSRILLMSPPICVTPDGKSFIEKDWRTPLLLLISFIQKPDPVSQPQVIASPTLQPAKVDEIANWKTYTDSQIGYTIKYPSEMLPSQGNCDSFIFPDSEEERKIIKQIKDSGIEIGYTIKGLELGFCIMNNPNNLNVVDFAKNHSRDIDFKPFNLNNYEGVKGSGGNFVELFINSPDKKLLRVWYSYGKSTYQNLADQILSTLRFTN